jgi:hypothetical protein
MNTLFHSPGTCSLGIHVLLEEIGAPYELALIDVTKGKQHQPDYLAINPKSKVPALQRAAEQAVGDNDLSGVAQRIQKCRAPRFGKCGAGFERD